MKKYVVTSGCSFTRQYRRVGLTGNEYDFMDDHISQWKWPHFIQKQFPDYEVSNYGNPTNDNAVIANSILYGVDKLLKNGVLASDIKVVVQWSGWSRNSAFISQKKQNEMGYQLYPDPKTAKEDDYAHINDFINVPKKYAGEHGYFILAGGYHATHVGVKSIDYFDEYVKHVFSADERMIEYLKNILLVQHFCKLHNIEYKCFTMHNNFSKDYVNDEGFPKWRPENTDKNEAYHVVYNNYIPITWQSDLTPLFENNPYVKYLYDMVDFDKFWFYEKENVTKYGGQVEWSIKRYNFDEVSDNEDIPNIIWQEFRQTWDKNKRTKEDLFEFLNKTVYWQHTSPYLNEIFVIEELKDFLYER
jgi:hypothetical protein